MSYGNTSASMSPYHFKVPVLSFFRVPCSSSCLHACNACGIKLKGPVMDIYSTQLLLYGVADAWQKKPLYRSLKLASGFFSFTCFVSWRTLYVLVHSSPRSLIRVSYGVNLTGDCPTEIESLRNINAHGLRGIILIVCHHPGGHLSPRVLGDGTHHT